MPTPSSLPSVLTVSLALLWGAGPAPVGGTTPGLL